ncbi:amino acid kinase family protein [Neisseria musculi]|uniref:acetylglutamate kinase n=1 Tax=Neisseria musculi TaxID=1815583 RepID=A0A7H1MBL5_9NEIS|nr:amino acid kinase family protein [Neisseria musculi]
MALLKLVGINPVIAWTEEACRLTICSIGGKEGTFMQGMRVTDSETMDIVEMVLVGGHVNKEIVSLLNQYGGKAVGVTGCDSNFIWAKKLFIDAPECSSVDIGQVGVLESIDCSLVKSIIAYGHIPVVVPIGVDSNGEAFNINAELDAEKLLMMSNTAGVLDKNGNLFTNLTPIRAAI